MIKKDFLKSSFIYTFSSALSTAASFILLPFYTNAKLLSVADFGALSLYIGFSLLVQVLATLSIDFYVGVAYHELKNKPDELKIKLASLNGYLIFAAIIITAAFAIGGHFVINHFIENPRPESYRYMMMSVLTGVFNAHFKFYTNLLVHKEKPFRYFWLNILNFVTTILFSLLILYFFPKTLEGPLWGRLLSCLSIFIVSFSETTFLYGIALNRKFIKPVWQFCFPLLLTAIFQWVLSYSDRYIIKPLLFNQEVAIFDLAVKCSLLLNFLQDGLSSALSPRIFSLLREQNQDGGDMKEINKYYSGYNVINLILIPLNILFIPLVLPFFIKDAKYMESFLYFGIICSGLFTRSILNLFIFPIHVFRKTSRLILVNGIAACAQLLVGYLMVRQFKLYGAAFTLNIVKVIFILLFIYLCRDLISKKINLKKLIWLPFVAILITSLPELFISGYGIQMHIIHLIEAIVIIAITLFVYRNEIPPLLSWLQGLVLGNKRET